MSQDNDFLTDRRRHGRTRIKMRLKGIRLEPDGGDVVDTLDMVDISRSGIGARCERGFYPGQRMVVCLPLSGHGGRRSIYATVGWCRTGDEGYRVGMQFDTASVGSWCGVNGAVAAA